MKLNVLKARIFIEASAEALQDALNAFLEQPTAPDGTSLPEAEVWDIQYYIAENDVYGDAFTCMVIYA